MAVHVIPLKNGMWRTVEMSDKRHAWWLLRYRRWWATKGKRLFISPEMWSDGY